MFRAVFLLLLGLAATMFSIPAWADEAEDGCLSTDWPSGVHWTFPDEPIGPTWTISGSALNLKSEPDRGRFEVTLWRLPCSVVGSQVIMTVDNVDNARMAVPFIIEQGTDTYTISKIVVSDTTSPDSAYILIEPTSGILVSGIVAPYLGLEFFDHNAPFTIYADDVLADGADPVDIPAYDPSQYASGGSNYSIGAGVTGSWYNPAQSGHGFNVQVLPGNTLVATWYVFDDYGAPYWIVATGSYSGDTAVLQAATLDGSGARFPPNFDMDRTYADEWGTLKFDFQSCMRATVTWYPDVSGFTAGSMPIQHLSVPLGLSCP